jgi:hypothetical protein
MVQGVRNPMKSMKRSKKNYKQLYKSQGAPVMEDLLNLVSPKVNEHMKENMDKDFTEDEVKHALF